MIAAGTVNVTTLVRYGEVAARTPKAGILVVAINADGQVAGTATTDAQGKASLTIREGASVSAIYPQDNYNDNLVTTYVGVKPNDNLTFGDGYFDQQVANPVTGTGQLTIDWTAFSGAAKGGNFYVTTPCGGTTTTLQTYTVDLASCPEAATAPVLIIAMDQGLYTASAYRAAATFTSGSTVTFADADFTAQPANGYRVSMAGLDPVVTALQLRGNAVFPIGSYGDSRYFSPVEATNEASLNVPITAPSMYGWADLSRNGNYGQQTYYKKGASPVAITPSASMPWVADTAILNATPPYRLLWLETGSAYDAAVFSVNWSRNDGKTTTYYNWDLILPPGVADFRLGTPPTQITDLLPTATDNVSHDLTLVDLSSAASYDAARALPEWRLLDVQSSIATGEETAAALAFDGEGFAFAARAASAAGAAATGAAAKIH